MSGDEGDGGGEGRGDSDGSCVGGGGDADFAIVAGSGLAVLCYSCSHRGSCSLAFQIVCLDGHICNSHACVYTRFFWYSVINITKNHFIFLSNKNFTVNRHEAILLQHQLTFQCFQNSAYLWCCSQLPSWQRWTSPLHRPHHFLMRCVACTDHSFLFHWLISLPLPHDSWILLYLSFQEVFYNNSNPFRNFYRIKINNKPTS